MYSRLIANVLGPSMQANGVESHVSNFFDDLGVAEMTWLNHLRRLEQVFKLFQDAKIYPKPNKCVFGYSRLEFCGQMLSRD